VSTGLRTINGIKSFADNWISTASTKFHFVPFKNSYENYNIFCARNATITTGVEGDVGA
jgi:hypothetical protein